MITDATRVLITGGAGFIGSHLCEEVLKHTRHIVVVDDLSTGTESNIPLGVEFFRVDISKCDELYTAMRDIDVVFHVAAQPSTRSSIEDPDLDFLSNALGTYNVLIVARDAGIKRIIYTSSSAIYGEPERLPIAEKQLPGPMTPYGASKLCGENYCNVFARAYGLDCTCLRPFNVYGSRENLETSLDEVVHYTRAVTEGQPITVNGDGSQTRDYIYVKDVVRAHVMAANNDNSIGKVLNIGTGGEIRINDLIKTIEVVTGRKAEVQYKPWPEGDIKREYADISLAKKVIGYQPETRLSDGIRQLIGELQTSRT